jgi:LAO/AO transport system kinase
LEPAQALALLRSAHRRTLARTLSRAESRLATDREWLDALWAANGPPTALALRVAVTGPPGAGKSSLLEVIGPALLRSGHGVAVLPVDPSSRRSGGSLLADVTRMPQLSADPRAYVRPSASRQMLGGVAVHTLESVEICELAGYDSVFVETVGVGQSEADAELVADVVMLVVPPHSGDALQALKRGINEICDAVVVNKADGPQRIEAERLAADYEAALSLFRETSVPVFCVSSKEGTGIDALTEWLDQRRGSLLKDEQASLAHRAGQRRRFFERVVNQSLLSELLTRPGLAERYDEVLGQVQEGRLRTRSALARIIDDVLGAAP